MPFHKKKKRMLNARQDLMRQASLLVKNAQTLADRGYQEGTEQWHSAVTVAKAQSESMYPPHSFFFTRFNVSS